MEEELNALLTAISVAGELSYDVRRQRERLCRHAAEIQARTADYLDKRNLGEHFHVTLAGNDQSVVIVRSTVGKEFFALRVMHGKSYEVLISGEHPVTVQTEVIVLEKLIEWLRATRP